MLDRIRKVWDRWTDRPRPIQETVNNANAATWWLKVFLMCATAAVVKYLIGG